MSNQFKVKNGLIVTGSSELSGSLSVLGTAKIDTVSNSIGDILTITNGIVNRRTRSEILSDIGGAPATGSTSYIQNQLIVSQSNSNAWLSGELRVGNTRIQSNIISRNDTSGDLTIRAAGSGSIRLNSFVGSTFSQVLQPGNNFTGGDVHLTQLDTTSALINRQGYNLNEDGVAGGGIRIFDNQLRNNKTTNQPSAGLTHTLISVIQQGTGSLGSAIPLSLMVAGSGTGTINSSILLYLGFHGPTFQNYLINNFSGIALDHAPQNVTNSYGVSIGNLVSTGTSQAIRTGVVSGVNKWNIYAHGSAANYFLGNVLIGSTTDSGEKLQVNGTVKITSVANSPGDILTINGSNVLTRRTRPEILSDIGGVSTGSFNTYTSSNDTTNTTQNNRLTSIEISTGSLNTFTSSINTTIKNRLNVETVISGSSQLTSSFDTRYVISGSIAQTTWDNILNRPSGLVSGSSQITLGGHLSGTANNAVVVNNSHTHTFSNISDRTTANTGITSVGTLTTGVWNASVIPLLYLDSNIATLSTTQSFTGTKTFNLDTDFNTGTRWMVSSTNSAHQRADSRIDSTDFARLHWYGVNISGSNTNFRHAWYDGTSYINITAASNTVTFSGQLTATQFNGPLSGNASTATTLQTARTINGVSFNGSANITVPTPNTLTIGTGLTGTSFNGSSATTIAIDSTVTTLTGTQTLTNKTLTSPRIGTGIFDTNGNEVIQIIPVANAVNDLSIQNAATGQPVVLTTSGTDANINLAIRTKGTGNIEIDTGASTGTIDIKPGASNLRLWDDNSTHYYEFVTGDRTANYTITLPASNVELVGGTMVPTSRTIAIANGTGITGGSAAVDLSTNRSWTIGLTGQALALHNLATNGIISRTGTGTVAARTISAGTGITVTNGDGVSGNPTISLPNSGVTAGTYRSVTTDATGRITGGTNPTTISEYGITDAQTALRSSATFTTTVNGWYRIATSALNINRNSGEFVVDWSASEQYGSIRFAAAIHYSASPSIMQTNYSLFGTGGITEARIVYHTTYTGNYAYVEVKFASAVTDVSVNVELQDALGWTLVTPSTVGSIPSGYTSYDHTFVTATSIISGTYTKVTINQEGRTISGTTLSAADIPNLDTSKLTTGTLPVTRGGTGVTTSTGTGNVVLSTSPTLTTPNIGNATGGTLSLSGQLTSTLANNTANNGGQIFLNGDTGNRIDWNTNGVAFPTFTTRSVGTKLTIFPGVAAAAVDYAIGIGTSSIWYSTSTTSTFHRWYAGTTNVMTLTGTGRLLINTTIDNGNELNVGGNISCTTITETSSRRYKDNIIPIVNSLDKIIKLQGVTYTRKETNVKEYGLIAEEVYDVLPELVNKNLDGEIESISYARLTSLLVEAIKEQQIQINELKNIIYGNT